VVAVIDMLNNRLVNHHLVNDWLVNYYVGTMHNPVVVMNVDRLVVAAALMATAGEGSIRSEQASGDNNSECGEGLAGHGSFPWFLRRQAEG